MLQIVRTRNEHQELQLHNELQGTTLRREFHNAHLIEVISTAKDHRMEGFQGKCP